MIKRTVVVHFFLLILFLWLTISTSSVFASTVINAWSGALTDTSARVNARISSNGSTRIVWSALSDMSTPVYSTTFIPLDTFSNWTGSYFISGLIKDTRYYYAIEIDGSIDLGFIGTFKTVKVNEPYSFSFVASACSPLGNNSAVFDSIRLKDPTFFFITGDFFYADISTNLVTPYRSAYNQTLTLSNHFNLYKNVPIVYMWDDHDFGPNNSNSLSPSRSAAISSYKENVPHYPLAAGVGEQPIYQAFTIGRVRFIASDLRSAKIPGSPGTMMGATQLNWFKQELIFAKNNNLVIVWMSSVPFISDDPTIADASDNWAAYKEERKDISDFIVANGIKNIFILSGDAHMLAIDDGTNSDYSSTGNSADIPVFQAAALGSSGSFKGGPYSHGSFQGSGQYGLINVIDLGGNDICFQFKGNNINYSTSLVSLNFCSLNGVINTNDKVIPTLVPKLTIFPNPVKRDQSIFIEYELPQDAELTIELVNEKGSIVYYNKSFHYKGLVKEEIDKLNLSSGMYHVLIKSNIESLSRKIIVR